MIDHDTLQSCRKTATPPSSPRGHTSPGCPRKWMDHSMPDSTGFGLDLLNGPLQQTSWATDTCYRVLPHQYRFSEKEVTVMAGALCYCFLAINWERSVNDTTPLLPVGTSLFDLRWWDMHVPEIVYNLSSPRQSPGLAKRGCGREMN